MPLTGMNNWNRYLPPGTPGQGGFRGALNFYGNELGGPDATGAGDLAGSAAMDSAAGDYYGTGVAPVDTGGAGQADAQGRFGKLLQGAANAQNARLAGTAQSKVAGVTGIEGVAQAEGSDIANNASATIGLQNAQTQGTLQNAGLLSGIMNSFISPTGGGSQITSAITGGSGSGLSQLVSGGGGLLSSLMGGGGLLAGGTAAGGDILGAGALDTAGAAGGLSSLLDFLPFLAAA